MAKEINYQIYDQCQWG